MHVASNVDNYNWNRFRNIVTCESKFSTCNNLAVCCYHSSLVSCYTDDDHRVTLHPIPTHANSAHSYINASYIDVSPPHLDSTIHPVTCLYISCMQGYSKPQKYIATQGIYILYVFVCLLSSVALESFCRRCCSTQCTTVACTYPGLWSSPDGRVWEVRVQSIEVLMSVTA